MGTNLARQLERYYTKVGNKILFRNGMTLTKLAWEMDVDPGFLSKVINGKDNRLFSRPQREVFCKALGLTNGERWNVEYALHKDYYLKHDLESGLSAFPRLVEIATDNLEALYRVCIQGTSPLAEEMAEVLSDQLREIALQASP